MHAIECCVSPLGCHACDSFWPACTLIVVTPAAAARHYPPCREAEQRARAARLYDRQRQRFQRALLAAEDLEGADTSVFNAVSRKGSVAAPGGAAAGAAAAGSAPGGGAAGTGAAMLPPAAEAAVSEFVGPVHSIDADDDG